MDLKESIGSLPRTRSLTISRFKSLAINTYWDLINYFPFRYEDYSLVSSINKIQEGEVVTIKGKVIKAKFEITRKGTRITRFTVNDNTGQIDLVWYNQPYLYRLIKTGLYISTSGPIKKFGNRLSMVPESYELIDNLQQTTIHTARLIPIYSEKIGLTSRLIREKMFYLISSLKPIEEIYPKEIIKYNDLIDQLSAYTNIHFPQSHYLAKKARERLAFDELFIILLNTCLIRKDWDNKQISKKFTIDKHKSRLIDEFLKGLPFKLTHSQLKSVDEIKQDMIRQRPMNRFLQGDVGSGKTVVALIGCYIAYLNNYQSLIMAPTEILACQHYETISRLSNHFKLRVGLQTKSQKINNPDHYDIIVGTHALINMELNFNKVGLVVIDEQHRFGVTQRSILKKKGGDPHLLTMTATPIPRTVILTLYGELDLSVIDEMPQGRLPVKTYLVPKEKRSAGYEWIKKTIRENGVQVFIICPLIEESEIETLKSVRAAKKEYMFLKNKIFADFKVGLIHGKLTSKEKESMMGDFKNKHYNILVATSLVEVGIDIPNATIMVIEGAERFGLAQLHQLRGRVGRGSQQSFCLLFSEKDGPLINQRLSFFTHNSHGMQLAEYDLKLRGPGNPYGTKQHGYINLKIASLADTKLIQQTKMAVEYFVNKYSVDNLSSLNQRLSQYKSTFISRD